MAKGHWLDPLARRLLEATGQLPAVPEREPNSGGGIRPLGRALDITADRIRAVAAWRTPEQKVSPDHRLTPGDDKQDLGVQEAEQQEAVERELLALRLAQNPALRLQGADEVRRAAALGWRLDVNRATAADWLRLPGCSPNHVDLLLRLQASGVQLSGPDDLANLLELEAATMAAWVPLLDFRWYSDAPAVPATRPLEINQASAAELQRDLGLSEERCGRLLRERSRLPFQDLADLQLRLQFPPALLEGWIGRVRFSPGPAGPSLFKPLSQHRKPR
ncbi:hypothetical protein VB716_11075 [Synechococcus sp. CCY9201]|uniref:ComEA family DNA-binding protein n=1 Tax=unclassified Synechococcus TaxID=2626047 RepID=UPI002AD200F3|nr:MULTISPECIES: hypothetical protein [unclassified Synechococcus]MEA5421640.1 hypothetical protein [Synechococcus sp. CCY9202]MEA5474763.1 hypothetical protein [Synechococcus sp. CCY9201]CAK6691650.1 hypothetical protein IFHNHDMJ_01060 [Synechococcus sp. CBW1107]